MSKYSIMDPNVPVTPEEHLSKSKDFINSLIRYRVEMTRLFQGSRDKVENTIKNVIMHLENEMEPTREEIGDVYNIIKIYEDIVTFNPITDFTRDFLKSTSQLIFNWNKNTIQQDDIDSMINLILRVIDMNITINEQIQISKKLLEANKKYLNVKPQAYEASRAFLEAIDDELES